MEGLSQLIAGHWSQVLAFLFVLGRTSGLVISAPFWGGATVPRLIRVVIIMGVSAAVFPGVQGARLLTEHTQASLLSLLLLLGRELLFGLVLGWIAQLLFVGLRLAGQQMETKMGLGLTQLVNPTEGSHTSLLPAFLDLVAALVFLAVNGHHLLIQALVSSYQLLPLSSESPGLHGPNVPELVRFLITVAGEVFSIALRVSAPVVVGLLLTDVLMGIVSRVMPQLNLFAVILPVQFAFGVLLLLLSLPAIVWFCVDHLSVMSEHLTAVLVPLNGK
jgi:flagellar biosynthetic protein FliR